MKKLCATTLTLILVVCVLPLIGNAGAVITVGGLLSTDTVWSQGNTYKLAGSVGVSTGVTLTIEPGVTVDLASYYIQVNGTINAQGTNSKKVVFVGSTYRYGEDAAFPQNSLNFVDSATDWNDQTQSGCIVQNAFFQSAGTTVANSAPRLSYNYYNASGITVYSGSPTITNNEFYRASLTDHGAGLVSKNLFKQSGCGVTASGPVQISENFFDGCNTGATFWGETTFSENTVTNCQVGIQSDASTVTLTKNFICNNGYGVKGGAIIESNTIINNTVGIQLTQSSYLTSNSIKNNNIYNNSRYNLLMERSSDVDATNNYWGTTNSGSIGADIYDSAEDFSKGKVTYQPFLSSPSSSAPTAPSTGIIAGWSLSFKDGQPQTLILDLAQLAVVALAVTWIAILAVLVVRKRKKRNR